MRITNDLYDPAKTIEIKAVIPEDHVIHMSKSRNKQGRYKFQVTIDTNIIAPDVPGIDRMDQVITQKIREIFKD